MTTNNRMSNGYELRQRSIPAGCLSKPRVVFPRSLKNINEPMGVQWVSPVPIGTGDTPSPNLNPLSTCDASTCARARPSRNFRLEPPLCQQTEDMECKISIEIVDKCIIKLNCGKSAGLDGIEPEHLK